MHKIQRVTYRGFDADLIVVTRGKIAYYHCERPGVAPTPLGYRTVRHAIESYEAEVDWLLAPSATLPKSREMAYA